MTTSESSVPCVFCSIARGEDNTSLVHEDEHVIAFMDIQPIQDGHLLVVPRKHHVLLGELDPEASARLWAVVDRLHRALRDSGLPCEGVNVFVADGKVAGQEVPHVHVHLIPRNAGDGFGLAFPPHYGRRPVRARLDEQADKIRAATQGGPVRE